MDQFLPSDIVLVTEVVVGKPLTIYRTQDKKVSIRTLDGTFIPPREPLKWWQKLWRGPKPKLVLEWQAAVNSGLLQCLRHWPPTGDVEIDVVLIPFEEPYLYGGGEPKLLVTKIQLNGVVQHYQSFLPSWAPMLYMGKYDHQRIVALGREPEHVSGKGLHPSKGVRVRLLKRKLIEAKQVGWTGEQP